MVVCPEIHKKHINTVCWQNVELLNVKLVVHIVTAGCSLDQPACSAVTGTETQVSLAHWLPV